MKNIEEAFNRICENAVQSSDWFVALMMNESYYGGPEEGGWWSHNVRLVAFQKFNSEEEAEQALTEIERLAEKLNYEARREFGDKCLRELNWLEERGIDDPNYGFGEVDGEDDYFVIVTQDHPSKCESFGPTQYS